MCCNSSDTAGSEYIYDVMNSLLCIQQLYTEEWNNGNKGEDKKNNNSKAKSKGQ